MVRAALNGVVFAVGMGVLGCAETIQTVDQSQRINDIIAQFRLTPLPAIPYPAGNTFNPDRIALGKLLFFDPILAGEAAPRVKAAVGADPYRYRANDVACATCHFPTLAFADRRPLAAGVGGARRGDLALGPDRVVPQPSLITGLDVGIVPRNSPTVLNTAFNGRGSITPTAESFQFMDGRVEGGLEEQALFPVTSRDEMAGDAFMGASDAEIRDSLAARVGEITDYVTMFQQAFPGQVTTGTDITFTHIAQAIAAYERELVTPDAPYDRFVAGEFDTFNAEELDGFFLFFEKGKCGLCHLGPMLSDFSFRVLGVGDAYDINQPGFAGKNGQGGDFGRFHADTVAYAAMKFAFRVVSLRNVELTAPYFHSGSALTLRDAVDFYNRGGLGTTDVSNATLSANGATRDPTIQPLGLTPIEVDRIVAFLKTTTAPVVSHAGGVELVSAPLRVPSGLLPPGAATPVASGPFWPDPPPK